jgi:nucleoside-diphosphate-sugar epimerase
MATASALAGRGPLEVTVGRVFNLIGPGMPESLAFGRFAARLAEPSADPARIHVGRLDARRDFVDVRDAAAALIALATRGARGRVYNVASGESHSIQEGLDRLIALSGRAAVVVPDPDASRRNEIDDSRASVARIEGETDWRPTTSFEQSLRDLWESVARQRCSWPMSA